MITKTKLSYLPLALLCAILACFLVFAYGCTVKYSFTGASISSDVKTVSVGNFQNLATLVNPALSNQLTEEIKNRFVSQTSLNIVSNNGDLSFTGEIRNYTITPTAIQGNETAAMNRFTIGVRVVFENAKDPSQNYDRTFSQFEDFDSRQQFSQVEQELLRLILEKLVEDIFNNAVANW